MQSQSENLIMTINGYIFNTQLGFCHSHEHLFIDEGQSSRLVPSLRLDSLEDTVKELNLFKNYGGASIVDAQPIGCGRNASNLQIAYSETGVNIIASTGFHKLIFYPQSHWIHSMSEDQLSDLFIDEIMNGMYIHCDNDAPSSSQRSPIKPGIIKTASDINGPIDQYEKYFFAAANASRLTGLPILSHTEMGKGSLEQISLFTDNGVLADSIILCHIDRNLDDFDYQLEVAKTGVFLELDTIGRFKYHSDEEEAAFIIKMVSHGYEDKILLGLDCTRERMKSYGNAIGLDYLITTFLPLLKAYGLKDEIIKKFMIYNPAKAFTIKNRS